MLEAVAFAAPVAGESAPVEQPIEPAPAPEPIVAEEKPAEAVVVAQPPVEETPTVAVAAEQPAAEAEAVVVPAGPIDIEEIEDEEELERKGGKKKGKRKDRTLVFDEEHGVVIAKKQRKAGRGKDVFEIGEEDI